ncbi:HAD family hydrolase [Enterovibrio norvegicus]|uniref:HAD family hydrolase n=1 Tax=Enterovibrio norvegicus TaxID=188144 RepID=A0ABV4KYH2_9GAMM|nr:HAD-IA family hydrolase [Enterovibrio norvegicus]
MLKQYKLVIFDWDGTVMDSVARIVSCLEEAARLTGGLPTLSPEQLKQMIGLSLEKGFVFLYPDVPFSLFETWKAHYGQQFRDDNPTPHAFYPGVTDTLDTLKNASGKVLGVATGKSRIGLDRAMGETDSQHFFAATRTADETLSKPDPLMIHALLEELGINQEQAVMIGDTSHDMLLANNAGIDAIGITWGVHDAATLSQYHPVAIINTLPELLKLP